MVFIILDCQQEINVVEGTWNNKMRWLNAFNMLWKYLIFTILYSYLWVYISNCRGAAAIFWEALTFAAAWVETGLWHCWNGHRTLFNCFISYCGVDTEWTSKVSFRHKIIVLFMSKIVLYNFKTNMVERGTTNKIKGGVMSPSHQEVALFEMLTYTSPSWLAWLVPLDVTRWL